jgi:uncharacterized protein (TIGR01777 family)
MLHLLNQGNSTPIDGLAVAGNHAGARMGVTGGLFNNSSNRRSAMNIAITGGSGFVGGHLSRYLIEQGHRVVALGTRPRYSGPASPLFRYVSANTAEAGEWQDHIAAADVVFNLAGRTIFQRWSPKYKQQIFDSRIRTTRHVVKALDPSRKTALISTSAVGYYGSCGDRELPESAPAGEDFLAEVGKAWESEALAAQDRGARVVLARFGIVLGVDGGALSKMIPAFRSFVGGPLGNGRQWFPWIHMADVIGALDFLAGRSDLRGPFNLCAPNPVRNGDMAAALGRALGRPAKMAVPAFVLKTVMGELAGVLLASQRALPSNLLAAGYHFNFPEIGSALEDLTR